MEPNHGGPAAVAAPGTSARDSVHTTTYPRWPQRRTVPVGPAITLVAQLPLIAALLAAVSLGGHGLGTTGWVVGIACTVITIVWLAWGLSHFRSDRLTPADVVTLARAVLTAVIAALVADSFRRPISVAMLVSLTSVALALDAVDGWLARRTGTGSLGATFDGEVDALLILVLSVYVARSVGAWVLLIGAARYAFLAAGWILPWLREPLPPRYWRKVVAATEGIVLAVAAADVLPPDVSRVALLGALLLLAESFGRDVLWLWTNRGASRGRSAVAPDSTLVDPDGPAPEPGRVRTVMAAALTIAALVSVWAALVAPDQPIHLQAGAFLRVPLEGLILIALAAVAPPRARRVVVWVVGPLLGLVVLLKLLNIGFFAAFDRPFDPYQDLSYAGTGIETLRYSIGPTDANLILGGLVALIIGVPALTALALRRLTRIAARHRVWSLRTVAGLGLVWLICLAVGAQFVSQTPIASTSAASLVVGEVNAMRADIEDHATFANEIRQDRFAGTPGDRLLAGLRGKDVILAFVESYGKVAVQGSSFSPEVDAVLNSGTKQLQDAGFSARSAFMTSPTFGGISWLAHSTMQSGLWVDDAQRYNQLEASERFTLSDAFGRAGWRTVDDAPENDGPWGAGKTFYHFDKIYDRHDVGYHGPTYAYASMPDQYVLGALQRLELAKRHRRPVFAEVDLVSSHTPWTRIPRMVPWSQLGDGSIFKRIPTEETGNGSVRVNSTWSFLQINGSASVQAAYGQSIQYTMNALISFVAHYRDPNLVLIALGDHQPWSVVSGDEPGHEVPISIIARPAVLRHIAGWGWSDGLLPSSSAPVWLMSAFRDRFLTTFGQ